MARIRSIKPEIASDAKLARLSRGTRYHFVLLWTVCDDAGFFRASPRQLLGQLYPHDSDMGEAAVDRMTAELADAGFLELHRTDDGPIGCVVNWSKHQKIDRPSKSHLHECVASGSRKTREAPSEGVLSPESLVLSPDLSSSAPNWKPGLEARTAARLSTDNDRIALTAILAKSESKSAVVAEIGMVLDGGRPNVSRDPAHVGLALCDYAANESRWNNALFRSYVQRAAKSDRPAGPRGGTGQRSYDNAVNALRDL